MKPPGSTIKTEMLNSESSCCKDSERPEEIVWIISPSGRRTYIPSRANFDAEYNPHSGVL